MATIKIGCRISNGYVMRWRNDIVVLAGSDGVQREVGHGFQRTANKGVGIINHMGYAVTEVEEEFWRGWRGENDGRNEIRGGLIFEIGN